jgi:galactokinase
MAPGRVNLIGEHTDYNGGYVLPCALTFGTRLLIRFNGLDLLRMASMNFDFSTGVPLSNISIKQGNYWINYPLGVLDQFVRKGITLHGMDMLFAGDIPESAGLSSSASIEMVTAFAVNDLYSLGYDRIELIHLARRAENHFVGVNCGIMDQFAVGQGKKDHAIFLDCDTLHFEHIPLKLDPYRIVIANTNKRRTLADSKYNERVDECNRSLTLLNQRAQLRNLGELKIQQFDELQSLLTDPVLMKRCRHIVTEDHRVLESVNALRKNDLALFGQLMNQSHDSLRDDYEVTGPELDAMVEESRKNQGVLGSRMTGAGFGGCTVSLVHNGWVDSFIRETDHSYYQRTGLQPSFYVADAGDGVGILQG